MFSILSTHDYFAWNRARWQTIDDLIFKKNIHISKIDGGFEFNGWYNYDPGYKPFPDKSWWWVTDDEYIISFGGIGDTRSYKTYNYNSWLFMSEEKIYVLKKAN